VNNSTNANCIILACVSPSLANVDGSMNELQYAVQAMNITTYVKGNVLVPVLTFLEGYG
jgi:hypothetical protein